MAILNKDTSIGDITDVYTRLSNIGGGTGKRYSTIVIGNSTNHTEDEVDYLCTGINDQIIINQAVNSLGVGGGKIIFLDGTYLLHGASPNGNISLLSNIVYEGMGTSTVFMTDGMYPAMYSTQSISNVTIRNICFRNTSSHNSNCSAINFNPMDSNLYIQNILIENCIFYTGEAIGSGRLIDGNNNITIRNNIINNANTASSQYAINLTGPVNNLLIEGNNISSTLGMAFVQNPVSPYNSSVSLDINIINNIFKNTNDNDDSGYFVLFNDDYRCNRVKINNNTSIEGSIYFNYSAQNVCIVGNYIQASIRKYAIKTSSNTIGIAISGNAILKNSGTGVNTVYLGPTNFNVVVGNYMTGDIFGGDGQSAKLGNVIND